MTDFKLEFKDHNITLLVQVNITSNSPKVTEYIDAVDKLTRELYFELQEKTIPVYLASVPHNNKISCIKAVRLYVPGPNGTLGLKEAKDLVEAPKPVCISPSMSRANALKLKQVLEENGAEVYLGHERNHILG